jgi:TolB-like protein/Flp pilus assembly protein TadD
LQANLRSDPELRLRIGIHLGDVVFADNTVLGDVVNVASRIHALAPPGGIYISANVYDEIRNQPGMQVKDLGEKRLKNVSRPIHVYALALDPPLDHTGWSIGQRRLLAIGIGLGLIVLSAYICFVRWKRVVPNQTTEAGGVPHSIRSIAVLPLDNFSGDPNQEYFADGMTDELTTDLAKISALRVISRGSAMRFKGSNRPSTPEIAKVLKVDAVVEGSVLRAGDKVRITAQLIDAPADKHLWADSFERDSRDVVALQDDLASAIAKEIAVQVTPDEQRRLTTPTTVNPAAYDAYLRGRYFYSRLSDEAVSKGIAQYREAIRLDPGFAPAYAGLSDAYFWAGGMEEEISAADAMPQIKAAADKAVRLDDNSAEAHASLATYEYNFEFDWADAEREYRRAIELNPSYSYAHDQYGMMLALEGRPDEALVHNQRAAELDPLSVLVLGDLVYTLAAQRNFESVKDVCRKISDLDTSSIWSPFFMGWSSLQAGKSSDAVPYLQNADTTRSPPLVTAWLGYAYGATGDRPHAMALLDELKKKSVRGQIAPYNLAVLYLGVGDRTRALNELENAYAVHSPWIAYLKVDRIFDPLRSEPGFIALMKKIHLEN